MSEDGQIAMIETITKVNFRYVGGFNPTKPPHPFTVGPKHIENSPGMYLDPDSAPCAECGLPYSAHASDTVAFVRLLRTCTLSEMKEWLMDVANSEYIKSHKPPVDGFAFLKSEEGYEIVEDKDEIQGDHQGQ